MRPRTVVVAHREALAAEGIAAALGAHPAIVPIGSAASAADLERLAERADAAAIDERLPGAEAVAARLRRRGLRVVFVGEGPGRDDGIRVPARAAVGELAAALVPAQPAPRPGPLSPQQRRVLSLVARGLTAKQVARQLGISPKTVEQHKARIFAKLGVPNQAAAVAVAAAGAGGGP